MGGKGRAPSPDFGARCGFVGTQSRKWQITALMKQFVTQESAMLTHTEPSLLPRSHGSALAAAVWHRPRPLSIREGQGGEGSVPYMVHPPHTALHRPAWHAAAAPSNIREVRVAQRRLCDDAREGEHRKAAVFQLLDLHVLLEFRRRAIQKAERIEAKVTLREVARIVSGRPGVEQSVQSPQGD